MPTQKSQKDHIHRIKHLMAMAEDEHLGEGARGNAMRKAMELMAKHGVDRMMLDDSVTGDNIVGYQLLLEGAYQYEQQLLMSSLCSARHCRAARVHIKGRPAILVTGYRSDVERVHMLFNSLFLQAVGEVTRLYPARLDISVDDFRRAWMQGYAIRIYQRLEAHEAAARKAWDDEHKSTGTPGGQDSKPGTALVLRSRQQKVDAEYRRLVGDLPEEVPEVIRGPGYFAGLSAGERADIDTTTKLDRDRTPKVEPAP